ncbi:hypothetical protein GF351_06595 [Candidatus Woesearchaeota archaeon]|nr:hypothetical protein [Candidatus Woesearchaeota archaeon]
MNKDEVIEDFKRRCIQLDGILQEFYDEEGLGHIAALAKGLTTVDKESMERIKRNLDVLRFETKDLIKATKRIKRLL